MITLEEEWGAVAAVPSPARGKVPWEDPELSGLEGFYRTLRDLLLHPGEFFDQLDLEGWAEPLAFALIVSTVGILFSLFWHLLILAGSPGGDTGGLAASLDVGPEGLLGMMIVAPFLVLIDLGVGSLCWWGGVALAGISREFTPTWRIFCYAHGGLALALIPFLGPALAGIWILILMYIGAQKVFGVSALSSLGALAIFLTFQATLAITLLLGLIVALASLGFLALLG
jgi:hypothetical protein